MNVSESQICCPECSISFWITWRLEQQLGKTGKEIFCPNGHSIYIDSEGTPRKYSKGKKGEILRNRLEKMSKYLDEQVDENYALRRTIGALRGVITRNKKKKA